MFPNAFGPFRQEGRVRRDAGACDLADQPKRHNKTGQTRIDVHKHAQGKNFFATSNLWVRALGGYCNQRRFGDASKSPCSHLYCLVPIV